MRIQQHVKTATGSAFQIVHAASGAERAAQLALAFGSPSALQDPRTWAQLQALHPEARIVGCSTAGEIAGTHVFDESVVVTAISFRTSRAELASVLLSEESDGVSLGRLLAARIPAAGLVHVLVLSDGLKVNGSSLVEGLVGALPAGVSVTGGLSGDGARFERTAVCLDGAEPHEQVVGIGLYGSDLLVGYGSLGGWDSFGPERRITKSSGNILYELDGEPALELYKRYLGEHASGLPASGLLFPLTIRSSAGDHTPVVRTILAVDEAARSLTFAGDVPVGYRARLMRANFERLVDGASGAATSSLQGLRDGHSELAILISCVGRKLVLKQRVEDELEAVREVLGENAVMAGFYSYGEISPFTRLSRCELHNQTMTITTLSES